MPEKWGPRIISISLEPKSRTDADGLKSALAEIAARDPGLRFSTDVESGQTILDGLSEQHLDQVAKSLIEVHKIGVNFGQPQVAYLEAPTKPAVSEYTQQKKTHEGLAQFAYVKLQVTPTEASAGTSVVSEFRPSEFPLSFVEAAKKGVNTVLQSGTLLGFPVTGARLTFLKLTAKEEHSSALAFEIAARMATRAALQKAGMRLLEPIMAVDFVVPTDHAHKIGQMIDMLRGRTIEITRGDKETNIRASIPMSNLFGLASNLRILTKGRGSHTIEFSHYDAVPKSTSENDPSNFPPAVGMRA